MKLTVCHCRKGSGFLNGTWRHVRNHGILRVQVTVVSVVVRDFLDKKQTNLRWRSNAVVKQAKYFKTWSFDMFLKWRHSSPINGFHYGSTSLGEAKAGNFNTFLGAKWIKIVNFVLGNKCERWVLRELMESNVTLTEFICDRYPAYC